MKVLVKIIYMIALAAVTVLIFVGHAGLSLGSNIYIIDYICDAAIPIAAILGMIYFSKRATWLCVWNAVVLVLFLVTAALYYIFGTYYGVLFATTDFLVLFMTTFALFSGRA